MKDRPQASSTITLPPREVPVVAEVDVVVCGGGPAGIGAAVAAGRLGAKTILIECYGFLGGMATAGLVNPFMPYRAGEEQLVVGVFQDWVDGMIRRDGFRMNSFDPEAAKMSALELCLDAGVQLIFHAWITDVGVEAGFKPAPPQNIDAVVFYGKSGFQAVRSKIFVDCTGDADVAALAGCEFELGRTKDGLTQPMTLNFNVGGVDWDRMAGRREINRLYDEAKARGEIHCPRENVLLFPTTRKHEVHFNTTRVVRVDGTRTEDLTRAEIEARKQVEEIRNFLRRYIRGFENCYLIETGTQIGVRETRRVMGDYILTQEDVLGARKFDDVVARGNYPVDIHNPEGTGTEIHHLRAGESYDIPYRCLIPRGMDNLLIGGRPISADHGAHSSLRIMPIACAIGEAAGTAAALCTQRSCTPRDLDVRVLQDQLVCQGANIGSNSEGPNGVAPKARGPIRPV